MVPGDGSGNDGGTPDLYKRSSFWGAIPPSTLEPQSPPKEEAQAPADSHKRSSFWGTSDVSNDAKAVSDVGKVLDGQPGVQAVSVPRVRIPPLQMVSDDKRASEEGHNEAPLLQAARREGSKSSSRKGESKRSEEKRSSKGDRSRSSKRKKRSAKPDDAGSGRQRGYKMSDDCQSRTQSEDVVIDVSNGVSTSRERKGEEGEPVGRTKSILKKPRSSSFMFSGAEFRRPSLSLAKVEFQRRPTIVCETNIPLHLLLKFCIQTAYDASPWWIADDASVTIPRFPLPLSNLSKGPLQQKIGALTLNRYAFSLLFFLLPILLPLAVLLVPLKPHYEGTVIDHLGFSLVTMGITGAIMGANTLFWMENFFGELFPWRWTLMAAMGPATAAFHFAASLPGGGVLPYGVDVSMLFVVAAVGVWGCIVAPPAVRRRMDWCSHLWVGMGILVFSMLVTHLLLLIESANARGAHVAYVLIMILPVLFTRLTTDIQEAVPYTTQEFAMQCQGILTFVFSLATYCLLIFLSKVVPLWQLYLIFETVDVLSTLFVGPVWELWWKVGYLKTNKFQQSIFGWAQNPMKPKAVVMKYYTKAIAAVAFPVILSVLAESDNQQVFKMTSSDMLDAGKMAEIGACMVGEVVLSISWLVFLYIIMKTRCCQEDFNDLVIQFSKMFSVVQLEGVLATLLVFLIKAKPGNSEFLD